MVSAIGAFPGIAALIVAAAALAAGFVCLWVRRRSKRSGNSPTTAKPAAAADIDPTQVPIVLAIHGLSRGAQALELERRLARLPGVQRVSIHSATQTAHIDYDDRRCTPRQLVRAIQEATHDANRAAS